jgi:glycolate dehydrogenase FAD-binding subunit
VSTTQQTSDATLAAWSERVKRAAGAGTPLRLVGGATKDFYGQDLVGERFDTTAYAGIVDYDPTELVITVRCGTPLDEVEPALAEHGQMLGFEPPRFGIATTIGGCIAAGLSGPRRVSAGAVRDLVLGVRLLDGRGEDLSFGGRVMKNVAGFDVSRLVTGSLGTLGIVLEVSLRCLPLPKVEATRVLELGPDQAIQRMNEWGGRPLPLTATWYGDGNLYARVSGVDSAVAAAAREIGGSALDDADRFWTSIRDQHHGFFADGGNAPLWRLSVKSTAPYAHLGRAQAIEWGGALRWVRAGDGADAESLRIWARQNGGHAGLYRGDKSAGAFQPLDAPTLAIHRVLKNTFDPAGIFNRHRMYPDF